MTEMELQHLLDLSNFSFVYIVVQLGYAAIMSVPVFVFVLILRKLWPKKFIGLRILTFVPLLLIPCLARLKLYYEYKLLYRILYPWYLLVGEHPYLAYVYVAVSIGIAVYVLRRRRKLKGYLTCGNYKTIQGEKVLVIPFHAGAFSFGIIRPLIVISENIPEECTEEEIKTIIKHERTHIRRGHLIVLTLWNIYEVIYWMNPLLHLCARFLKEDIEYNCDMEVLEGGNIEPLKYGNILLKQMRLSSDICNGSAASFAGKNNYKTVKNRISRIAEFDSKEYKRKGFCVGLAMIAVAAGLIVLKVNSYPRYSVTENLVVGNNQLERLLIADEKDVKDAIEKETAALEEEMKRMEQEMSREMLEALSELAEELAKKEREMPALLCKIRPSSEKERNSCGNKSWLYVL